MGDIDKYGPRGNNQFAFQATTYIPDQYMGGMLATSWEFSTSPLSLTYKLRQGVMWTGNARIGMPAREFTSADAVFSAKRVINAPGSGTMFTAWIKDVVAIDKYTVQWQFSQYYANWEFFCLYGGSTAIMFAPESATAGGADWKNQVGTGPFILSDYVSGSSATYTRNPNYWGKTTIGGKQYQMPFINSLTYPVIADASTQLAALRTGKIDIWSRVPLSNAATLKQSSPNLVQNKWLIGQTMIMYMNRIESPQLSVLNIRKAVLKATDFNTIMKLAWTEGNILGWPVSSQNPAYTPLNQLPAATQDLFNYDPTKAKQMLADAGYPNGFATTIAYNAADPVQANVASIAASEWAKVGIVATLQPTDQVALTAIKTARSYKGFLVWSVGTINPLTPLTYIDGSGLGATYKTGEPLDIEEHATLSEMDPTKFSADVKQTCQDMLADAGYVPFADPYLINCYWPWLKNYYGEIDAGYNNQVPLVSRIWIDAALKKSLGY
jgi:peptide/nickel transport system substrate-binding protein